jgi:hypothetical protein
MHLVFYQVLMLLLADALFRSKYCLGKAHSYNDLGYSRTQKQNTRNTVSDTLNCDNCKPFVKFLESEVGFIL